jgi:urease subunit alpha
MSGVTSMLGGGTGPAHGTCDDLHARPLAHRAHDRGRRRLPDESRLRRQGQCLAAAALEEHGQRRAPARSSCTRTGARRPRPSTIASRRRRDGRAGDDPHRHAERVGLRRGHDQGLQGPHHPRLPHRGRGRRPCARHHQGRGLPNVLPSSTNPTRPFTVNTIDEHLDMLMVCHHLDPSITEDLAFRRKPHPQGDHRGRGHSARHRRALDDVVRQPGHGPRRRGHHPHVADGGQDEAPARAMKEEKGDNDNFRARRYIAKYTINPAIAHGVSRTSVRSRPASSPISCCGRRPSSA